MNTAVFSTVLAASLLAGGQVEEFAKGKPPKRFAVEEIVNEEAGFMIRVQVDRPDRIYYEGETMEVAIVAERDCYVYLLYYDAEDNIACLYPNEYQQENLVPANTEVHVPSQGDRFRFRARPPFGEELLQVVATLEPIDLFEGKQLTGGRVTPLSFGAVKGMETVLADEQEDVWAEARVTIRTVGGRTRQEQAVQDQTQEDVRSKSARVGVCIGISEYRHDRIRDLLVGHQDAQRMAMVLKEKCNVNDVTVLLDAQATKEAIRRVIFEELPRKSRPGDTVFVFFSGHGGRTSDTNGDENDGLDEYLVPHDGILGEPDSMILDDTFARWMAELDGRQVVIIMDNCYSGGSSKSAKGLGDLDGSRTLVSPDFFDGELKRAKDLGQTGTAIIAASQANQIAWEMPTGEGSVLTYHLIKSVGDPNADTDGDGLLRLSEVYRYLKGSVEDYVRETFMTEQNPLYLDNAGDAIIFRP